MTDRTAVYNVSIKGQWLYPVLAHPYTFMEISDLYMTTNELGAHPWRENATAT